MTSALDISSLRYLQHLPVDELKIDRSFVRHMVTCDSDLTIVRSTIDLAHGLGLKVVAEGVEDALTWRLLAESGCDQAQGYFISQPMPVTAATDWLRFPAHPIEKVRRARARLTRRPAPMRHCCRFLQTVRAVPSFPRHGFRANSEPPHRTAPDGRFQASAEQWARFERIASERVLSARRSDVA